MRKLAILILLLVPTVGQAQVKAGQHYLLPSLGVSLPVNELLRNTAPYRTFRISDPVNPVVTDIRLDPGIAVGLRYGYGLTRRLSIEGELSWQLSVHAIRQLEIKPDTRPGSEPQYETTTTDSRTFGYALAMNYFLPMWPRLNPFVNVGVGNRRMDLVQKGVVDPDPVFDRTVILGLGCVLPANDRLGIRLELRDFMYNFRYDNQFVDPAYAPFIVDPLLRPDFYNTTSTSGTKFQNDFVLTFGCMVRIF